MTFQRLGLIGDIHAQRARLQQALDLLSTHNVQAVLCTGDIVDGPTLWPEDTRQCIELLQQYRVLVVRGNHDRWLLADQMRELPGADSRQGLNAEALGFLRGLPSTLPIETCAGKLLLCHGMGGNDMQGVKPEDDYHSLQWKPELQELINEREYSYIVAGHTHTRMLRRLRRTEGALTLINAGTLHPAFSPCCAIADFEKGQLQFFDLQSEGFTGNKPWEL